MPVQIEMQGRFVWMVRQPPSEGRRFVAVCEPLNLSMEGDSLDELFSLINEAVALLMIDLIADQIPSVPRKAARRQATATLATLMGALVMARIAGNGEFSDEIMAAGREAALGRAPRAKPAPRLARAKPS